MSWYERMNRAVDYMENNLCGDIDPEALARITYQSATSFQRTFSIVTEMSVSEYIRRRRMSLAAFELQSGNAKVIDTALKYGYDSPEAFTRAFKEIYGVSPSAARKEGTALKTFPRISFLTTVKGDVVMDYKPEQSAVRVTNLYRERLPAIRFIGKRYTAADLNAEGQLMDKWNEWFGNGWFNLLSGIPGLEGYEGVAHTGYHNGEEMSFWIGMMFPKDTPAPEGFDFADFPAGDTAVCWVNGYRETGELFTPAARNLCLKRIREAGYAMKLDFDGEPCRWTFERYNNQRFFMPDGDGKITMDYCMYVVERDTADDPAAAEPERRVAPAGPADNVPEQPNAALVPELRIDCPMPYWVDVENNLFFCAMTTLFLKLKGYEESTPFFCARNARTCDNCGDCGDMGRRPTLAKHHLSLYHRLLTVSGVGLTWGNSDDTGDYDLKTINGIVPPMLEDRLDFLMKAEGFEYARLDKPKGEREIFRQITASIREGKPVLIKLGESREWLVVTGVDSASGALFGLDARDYNKNPHTETRQYTADGLFVITDWFRRLNKVIIVTGKTAQALPFGDLTARMAGRLRNPERGVLEAMIPQMIDALTVENAHGVADYLNRIAGDAAETRWHAAECFGELRHTATQDETTRARLAECVDLFFDTHDTCWQIWAQLGVGPHTNFRLPSGIGRLMMDKERQEKLKELFARIFGNDRGVMERLEGMGKGN